MEKKKKKQWKNYVAVIFGIFLVLLMCSVINIVGRVFSYDTNVAHPNIAELAAKLYNQTYPDKQLTKQQITWIKQGTIDEDSPTRWLNHFYDPINNRGIFFLQRQLSAKAWYNNQSAQRSFALGDYTWNTALTDFNNKNEEQAFKGLGHVLHILADMTVPAHTRDDSHPSGDSYEQFLKKHWDQIAKLLKYSYLSVNNLNDIVDELANYSNNNFYSDDTIKDGKYNILQISDSKTMQDSSGDYYVYNFINGYKIFASEDDLDWQLRLKNRKHKGNFVDDSIILTDYAQLLLPKAIGYSAGAIKLFFDEAEKHQEKITESRINALGYTDYLLGKGISFLGGIKDYFKTKTGEDVAYTETPPTIESATENSPEPAVKLAEPIAVVPTVKPVVNPPVEPKIEPQSPVIPVNDIPASQTETPVPETAVEPVVTPPVVYSGNGGHNSSGGNDNNEDNTPTIPDTVIPTTTPTSTIPDPVIPTTTPTSTIPDPVVPTSTPTSTIPDPVVPTTTPTSTIPDPIIPTSTCTDAISCVSTTTPPTETTSTDFSPIIISEIAWMGTGPTPDQKNDEWLELYNNTDAEIDLSEWQILVNNQPLTWNKINPTIPAHSYYLLERTDDGTVVNIPANAIFTLSGGLNNSGANLKLVNAVGETVDEIDCTAGWYAGVIANYKYRSMQRIDSFASGTLANNWQTAVSVAPKAKVNGGGAFYGSPKLPNQGYWLLSDDLSYYYNQVIVDNVLHLTKANGPYFIDYETKIPSGLKVEVDPGVVLIGYDRSSIINVSGELNFLGTAEEPIVITSALDSNNFNQNYLAFTNLTAGEPAPGDWGRIQINQNGKLLANYTNFFYGGARFLKNNGWVYGTFMAQVMRNLGGTVVLNNTGFNYNYLEARSDELANNSVIWNETPVGGVTNLTVESSNFIGGNLAIKNDGSTESAVNNNYFSEFQSNQGPIITPFLKTELNNNQLVNNAIDRIEFGELILDKDVTLVGNSSYSFSTINVPSGYTLTVEPGVILYLLGNITINGNLEALGTEEAPINIIPKNEHWGILNLKNAVVNLNYTNLEKGNHTNAVNIFYRGMITAENSTLNLQGVNLKNSERPANMVYAKNSALQIDNSRLEWTEEWNDPGDWTIISLIVDGGSLSLTNSYIDNTDVGVQFYASAVFDPLQLANNTFSRITLSNWLPLIPN